jgi:hypothetical protein
MLRRDSNAAFAKSGRSIFSRYRFETAGFASSRTLNQGAYEVLLRESAELPVLVAEDETTKRRWWLHQETFYREAEGFDARTVLALILERSSQKERRVKRAIALMEQAPLPDDNRRAPIPDDVRAFVWNRDGGRCVQCGGRERLEFDHLIPFSMGGSNTARNLQLLCEGCNRAKGASIA